MFLAYLYPLSEALSFLNVFRYITFRTLGAAFTGVLFCMLLGPRYIAWIKKKQFGQFIRSVGPQSHLKKQGTPTMGGGLILASLSFSLLLWGDLSNRLLLGTWFSTLIFGLIGCIDDYRKVARKENFGLSSREKFIAQIVASVLFLFLIGTLDQNLYVPFLKHAVVSLGPWILPFAVFVVVGASNAVNLTDGLDGLAVGPVMTTSMALLVLAYCAGHVKIADYLQISYVAGSGELAVFCAALSAACLGFLWYNTYPAQIFMGDTGSLSLGAALGMVAICSKQELLLPLCGGVFVVEVLSVILQVISFQTTGRRIFKMAPLHHHFELKGWAEPQIIVRFWIVSILLAIATLSTLKLR